jgi:hypothetical protein
LDEGSGALFMEESPKDTLIFVSGLAKFVLSLEPSLRNKSRIVVALDLGNQVSAGLQRSFPSLSWVRVAHEEVGGVTVTWNWIGSTPEIALDLITKVLYCRTISKILKPTLKGRFAKDQEPPKATPTLEDEEERKFLLNPKVLSHHMDFCRQVVEDSRW